MDTSSWQAPPTEVLGQAVPIQALVARTGRVVVALHYAVAFPQGCVLSLRLAVRRGSLDEAAWERAFAGHFGRDPDPTPGDGGLRLGVRFADGSTATTVDQPFPGWARPADRPAGPMLVEAGSESSSNREYYDSQLRLWLWPLPPPAPFEFLAEWQSMGLDLASATLDGSALVRAAGDALPLWT